MVDIVAPLSAYNDTAVYIQERRQNVVHYCKTLKLKSVNHNLPAGGAKHDFSLPVRLKKIFDFFLF